MGFQMKNETVNKNFISLFHSPFEIPFEKDFLASRRLFFPRKITLRKNPKFPQSAPTLCPIAQKRATTRKRDRPYRILHKIWHLLTLVLG